jgi:hypothetical protein
MRSVSAGLAELTAALRAEQSATTESVLEDLLRRPTGNVRAVAVDAARGSVVLVVDDLAVRAAVGRAAQARELQRLHRAARVELASAAHIGHGQVLLGFSDGRSTVPVVVEALTRVTV